MAPASDHDLETMGAASSPPNVIQDPTVSARELADPWLREMVEAEDEDGVRCEYLVMWARSWPFAPERKDPTWTATPLPGLGLVFARRRAR